MKSPIERLKERIFKNKGKKQGTILTRILEMVREFNCFGEVIGREFEVRDSRGKLVYTIHQKPMAIKQMDMLLQEYVTIKDLDEIREANKWSTKGKKRGK